MVKLEMRQEDKEKKLWVKVKAFALLNEDGIYSYVDKLKEEFKKKILYDEAKLLEKNIKKFELYQLFPFSYDKSYV